MKVSSTIMFVVVLISLSLSGCQRQWDAERSKPLTKVLTTQVQAKSLTLTQKYLCQIKARRHVNIRAFDTGYLKAIEVADRQAVKEGTVLFNLIPLAHNEKQNLQQAETNLAQLEFNDIRGYYQDKVTPQNQPFVSATIARAEAKVRLEGAKLISTAIRAPFDGIVEGLCHQEFSRVEKGDNLATLSDSSRIRVDFFVPEARYLELMRDWKQRNEQLQIELVLSNGEKYEHTGTIGEIDADFNGESGNICFHADFPNPDRQLRHGQVGNVLIRRELMDAIQIPLQATFVHLSKQYVYVIDKENVTNQREIEIQNDLEDTVVVKHGLNVGDRIIVERPRRVRAGEKVKWEDQPQDRDDVVRD